MATGQSASNWQENIKTIADNTASGGGGGGAVTVADGADVAQGTTTDAAYTSGAGTIIALLKGVFARLAPGQSSTTPLYASLSAQSGYVAAWGSNPTALTANTDASFKWGGSGTTVVNHIMIQNNTALNVLWDLDVATSAGSPILGPNQTIFLDVQTTALHLQANGTPNINGTSGSNIVVRAWL